MKEIFNKTVKKTKYTEDGVILLTLDEGETLDIVRQEYKDEKYLKYGYPQVVKEYVIDGIKYEGNMVRIGWKKYDSSVNGSIYNFSNPSRGGRPKKASYT